MVAPDSDEQEEWKKQVREELKQELLAEIHNELQIEETSTAEPSQMSLEDAHAQQTEVQPEPEPAEEKVIITMKPILKIACHALKYANDQIPRSKWVEVIGVLAGKLDRDTGILVVGDAYPISHGNAIYAKISDFKNFVRVFSKLKKKGLFICGWYHSHPTYGLFMSQEDFGTQARYQQLWDQAVALVIDPFQIDGTRLGFDLFRGNLQARRWITVPFKLKDPLNAEILPNLVKFIRPIVEGRVNYRDYDDTPTLKSRPTPQLKPSSKLRPTGKPSQKPTPKPKQQPKLTPKIKASSAVNPRVKQGPKSKATKEPQPKTKPSSKLSPKTNSKPKAKVKSKLKPKPKTKPKTKAKPKSKSRNPNQ